MDNPKVLIAVPTYGRPDYLPRLLASFKELNYNNKKLLIINDDKRIKYKLDKEDPNIDICNMDLHLNLSVKRNLFASWDWDIIMHLDDDDIFLPERINNHLRIYDETPGTEAYKNEAGFCFSENKIYISTWTSFTNHSMTRKGWFKSLGYTAFERSNFDDQSIHQNVMNRCNYKNECDTENLDFIYWWGNSDDETKYRNTFNADEVKCDYVENAALKSYEMFKKNRDGYTILRPDFECFNNIKTLTRRLKWGKRQEYLVNMDRSGASEKIRIKTNSEKILFSEEKAEARRNYNRSSRKNDKNL